MTDFPIKKQISGSRLKAIAKFDSYYQYYKEALITKAWPAFLHFVDSAMQSQNTTLSIMAKINVGHLEIWTEERVYEFGSRDSQLKAKFKVLNESFWVRLLLFADLGFAEAYMLGDVVCDDLGSLINVFAANRNHIDDMSTVPSYLFNTINYFMNTRFANTVTNAINNISAHYDISNDMFAAFLSTDMTYSCALFDNVDEPLEKAQMRKLREIIRKAKIGSEDHVLEIGSGWGSFAIEVIGNESVSAKDECAAKSTGCRVTTLTLSIEQKRLAEERIFAAGLSDRIVVLLCDYRNLPASHQFDKIVSIEMIEAVGPEYLATYFECCDKLLKKQDGIAVFQVITMPETRYDRYCKEVDFIRKYIFPGGHCPTVTSLVQAIHKGSRGRLIVESIDNIGPHYARTLRLWREQFLSVFDESIGPTLIKEHPEMKQRDVDIFKRKWEFYFAYCEGGFVNRILGNVHVVLTREGNKAFLEGVPL
ncbi:5488_t:CDS:2 [Paraglomus occultum]|uniref:5488_t:CDS:1 n=1 Tax=Paraglomus occultum TaxID=144539 RepID=A0A9N8WGK5_9GLOM|nr:5488_t:CDS:2 [Paraglomus occultum]